MLTDGARDFITSKYSSLSTRAGIIQGIIGTITIALFVAGDRHPDRDRRRDLPRGVRGEARLTRFIDVNIRNLAGVPSVVYGILGLAIFVKASRTSPAARRSWPPGSRWRSSCCRS